MVRNDVLYWVTITEGNFEDGTVTACQLHTLADGTETEKPIPRGDHYCTDGKHIVIDLNGDILMICDMEGNLLKKETYALTAPDGADGLVRSILGDQAEYAYTLAGGTLYQIRFRVEDRSPMLKKEYHFSSVPLADYLNGSADFQPLLTTVRMVQWYVVPD
jgi:hypothetical protein